MSLSCPSILLHLTHKLRHRPVYHQVLAATHPAPAATLAQKAAERYLRAKTAWPLLHVSGAALAPLPTLLALLPSRTTVVALQHAGGVAAVDSEDYDPAFDPDGDASRGAPAQVCSLLRRVAASFVVCGEVPILRRMIVHARASFFCLCSAPNERG